MVRYIEFTEEDLTKAQKKELEDFIKDVRSRYPRYIENYLVEVRAPYKREALNRRFPIDRYIASLKVEFINDEIKKLKEEWG